MESNDQDGKGFFRELDQLGRDQLGFQGQALDCKCKERIGRVFLKTYGHGAQVQGTQRRGDAWTGRDFFYLTRREFGHHKIQNPRRNVAYA
jgi:hypothetical protein